jgi:hypothetical protein
VLREQTAESSDHAAAASLGRAGAPGFPQIRDGRSVGDDEQLST